VISSVRPLPIEILDDDSPVPAEAVELITALLLDAVAREGTL